MRSLLGAVVLLTAVAAQAAAPPIPNLVTSVLPGNIEDLPLPDAANGSPGTFVDLVLSEAPGVVVDVEVTIDLEHLDPSHLDLYLVSPSGTTVTLSTDNGASFDDVFAGSTFDDQASGMPSAPNVRNFTYTNLAATGAIQPEEALGKLIGEPAAGPWALVVNDDSGGSRGTLRSWSLTLSTLSSLAPAAPLIFTGGGGSIPNTAAGRESPITVSGAGSRLFDVNVSVDVTHPNADDLELFLTSPSGQRIDLVTDLGADRDDFYAPATFDDQAGVLLSDVPQASLPPSGSAIGAVAGEGALAAFVGEDPNGTWTLTAVDDAAGNSGTLVGWTLTLVTATACGDGSLDAGEVCDDANPIAGDGCDTNCTPTACGNGVVTAGEDCDDGNTAGGDGCPATCRTSEVDCADCVDDDENGLVDSADPACEPGALELRSGAVSLPGSPRGRLRLAGGFTLPAAPGGPVGVVLADGNGGVVCAALGQLPSGRLRPLKARVGSGLLTLKVVPRGGGRVTLVGRGLDLSALDDQRLVVGLRVGGQHFAGGGTFRARGAAKWVYP